MKTVVSYRYNGEIISDLELLLSNICNVFKSINIDPYCVYFEHFDKVNCNKSPSEMMQLAFSHIDRSDFIFVIQTSEARSEGMLMEIGYAFAKGIKVIIATKKGIGNTYLPSMADYSLVYEDMDDLLQQISKINFNGVKN